MIFVQELKKESCSHARIKIPLILIQLIAIIHCNIHELKFEFRTSHFIYLRR